MAQPPSFPFYPADWLLGTLTFSLAEDGAYLRLVMHQWNAGSVPGDDLRALAGIIRTTEREARGLWAVVGKKFVRGDDGGWRNERLEFQRAEKVRYHQAQAVNGRASAAARAAARAERDRNRMATTVPTAAPTNAPTTVATVVQPPHQPDSNLSLALVPGPIGPESAPVARRRGTRYGDPFGFRPDIGAAATVIVSESQRFSIPEAWASKARGRYGLSHEDVDRFASWLAGEVRREGGQVRDGGRFFDWLDGRAARWLDERARPNDGLRPAAEFIEEQARIAASIPARSPEQVRELLRPRKVPANG